LFDRGLLVMVFLGIAGAPLLWLATLQTGYTLSYQACDDRATSWVLWPLMGALLIMIGIVLVAAHSYRRALVDRLPMPLLGRLAIAVSVLSTLTLAASAIGPLILHACD